MEKAVALLLAMEDEVLPAVPPEATVKVALVLLLLQVDVARFSPLRDRW